MEETLKNNLLLLKHLHSMQIAILKTDLVPSEKERLQNELWETAKGIEETKIALTYITQGK
jgi:hypothetical protein